MNKHLYRAAAAAGLVAIGWVAFGYLRSNPLANPVALGMTLLIAATYVMGALELHRFQQATGALQRALNSLGTPPAHLADWLAQVPAPLRNAVRLRVDGERAGLPGPALTPYLVGLLVLLGMLGTFLGMVVTLNGTGLALESATDVQSMRDSLSAPVRGLGLAFGTSVAGVAASAMLGLMSALSRRERQQVGQLLDAQVATALQPFTRAFRQQQEREQALQLQQQQARHLPALVDQLQALATALQLQAQQSNEHLLASQQRFQGSAEKAYRDLAASVDQTLQRSLTQSLTESARLAAATLQPVVEATMAGITRETAALHGQVASSVQQQLDGFAQRFEERSGTWVDAMGAQLGQQSGAVLLALDQAQSRQHIQQATRDEQQQAAWAASLKDIAATLQREWQQAGAQTLAQQAQICATLEATAGRITTQAEAQTRSTVAEVARLVQTASEAPRAAADVVAQLRDKLSESLARDNAMLEERSRIMNTLNMLLGAVQHTATEQKAAIDKMVASTASWLDQAGARFTEKVDTESARMEHMAAQLSGSAADVASLGEAFGTAVDLFAQATGQTVAQLQRVEEALSKSSARSDDQLAYYVAQAREVIDLSLLSQKQIVDDLQRLARQQAALPAAADA